MKKVHYLLAFLIPVMLLVSGCGKEDSFVELENAIINGDALIDTGSDWNFDKAHSNVEWETMYFAEHAFLTGRFNDFGINILFDEKNPEASTINAWVRLTSANTGEPMRDILGGCLNGYLGVFYDTLSNGAIDTLPDGSPDPAAIHAETDTSWFRSTSVRKSGDGYISDGDFSFRGMSKSVDLRFKYLGTAEHPTFSGSQLKASFSGEFTIKALTVWLVPSTSIADDVTIRINCQVNKNL